MKFEFGKFFGLMTLQFLWTIFLNWFYKFVTFSGDQLNSLAGMTYQLKIAYGQQFVNFNMVAKLFMASTSSSDRLVP